MEHLQRGRQLDLLALAESASQQQRLDPLIRAEITNLLKLLLSECTAPVAGVREEDNE